MRMMFAKTHIGSWRHILGMLVQAIICFILAGNAIRDVEMGSNRVFLVGMMDIGMRSHISF